MYKLRLHRLVVDDIYVYMSRKLGKRSTAKLLINCRGFFFEKNCRVVCFVGIQSLVRQARPSFFFKKNYTIPAALIRGSEHVLPWIFNRHYETHVSVWTVLATPASPRISSHMHRYAWSSDKMSTSTCLCDLIIKILECTLVCILIISRLKLVVDMYCATTGAHCMFWVRIKQSVSAWFWLKIMISVPRSCDLIRMQFVHS